VDRVIARLLAGRWTGGSLFRITLSATGKRSMSRSKLADRVADNLTKFGPTESESLLIGKVSGQPHPSSKSRRQSLRRVDYRRRDYKISRK
jgi:hypothetical protein